jgi:hypothetical protein
MLASLISVIILAALSSCATFTSSTHPEVNQATEALFDTVSALDAAVFDSFNNCNSPEQLQRHASYFAPDVEFYHDTGGVTWTRQEMLANTEKYVCGKWQITRVLSFGHRPSK